MTKKYFYLKKDMVQSLLILMKK